MQKDIEQSPGVFIVIEGTDGSGKGTQFALLAEQLQQDGYDVALFDFPRYNQPSSYFVKRYLNGEYGTAEEVGPYTGSLFYALDRYDAAPAIHEALKAGKIVLANRFTASNMGHQGTKFSNAEQRRGFFIWLDNLEFETLRIPRPDLNIVLRVPAAIAQKLVDQKTERSYTDKKRDLHEADLSHLERAVDVYDDLCQLFPKDFSRIDCVRGGNLLSVEAINVLVREKVQPLLPKPQHHGAVPGTSIVQEPLSPDPTETAPTATEPKPPRPKAASVSTSPSVSQPAPEPSKDDASTTSDKEDAVESPKYYTPESFNSATAKAYNQAMTEIFSRYYALVQQLTDYIQANSHIPESGRNAPWQHDTHTQALEIAQTALPAAAMAATSTTDILTSSQAGQDEVSKAYLVNTHKAVHELIQKHLAATHSPLAANTALDSNGNLRAAILTDVWPHNELAIVPDILYEHTDLPLQALRDEVASWKYDQKADILGAYIGERSDRQQRPGRSLEKIHYSWDLVCNFGTFLDLQQHHPLEGLEWQSLTPRLGYDTPQLIEDAGLDELFDECFDLSLQLYSLLQRNGYTAEAQYATLLGHRLRWKVTYNARQAFHLHELHTDTRSHAGCRSLIRQMHEQLAVIHPLVAAGMKFVDQGNHAKS
jgi:dTMP kinase